MQANVTRRKILKDLTASLEPIYGSREAKSISEIVVCTLLDWTRADCVLEADSHVSITDAQIERLERAETELLNSRAVQYVVGECEFCSLRLEVREGVLIPRPETEELIEWIVAETLSAVRVLDIGTGSGAIAIALAKKLATCETMCGAACGAIGNRVIVSRVEAIDISEEALEIARSNAHNNGADVGFTKIDILSPPEEWLQRSKYDIIVSNPPYIPASDKAVMHANVLNYEPHIALFVDDSDPLIFYRRIAQHARQLLSDGGLLYFEIYEHMADELCKMLENNRYTDIEVRRDINDKPRMIRCRKSM